MSSLLAGVVRDNKNAVFCGSIADHGEELLFEVPIGGFDESVSKAMSASKDFFRSYGYAIKEDTNGDFIATYIVPDEATEVEKQDLAKKYFLCLAPFQGLSEKLENQIVEVLSLQK